MVTPEALADLARALPLAAPRIAALARALESPRPATELLEAVLPFNFR